MSKIGHTESVRKWKMELTQKMIKDIMLQPS